MVRSGDLSLALATVVVTVLGPQFIQCARKVWKYDEISGTPWPILIKFRNTIIGTYTWLKVKEQAGKNLLSVHRPSITGDI